MRPSYSDIMQIAELTKTWAGKWDQGIQQMVEVSRCVDMLRKSGAFQ